MIRNEQSNWIKAGIEITDGMPHAAVVVTREQSDWSLCPVPEWSDAQVTMRTSWTDGATTPPGTVRAGALFCRSRTAAMPMNSCRLQFPVLAEMSWRVFATDALR